MAAGAAAAAVKWEYSFFYENPQDLIPALNLSTLQFYSCSENQNSCFSNVWQCAHEGTRLQSWPVKFLRQNYMRTKYVFVDCKILGHLSHMIGYFFVVSCASGQVWWTLNHSGQWISLEVWQVVHMHAAAATYADPKRLQVNFFSPPTLPRNSVMLRIPLRFHLFWGGQQKAKARNGRRVRPVGEAHQGAPLLRVRRPGE